MSSIAKGEVIGNIGADANLRYMPNGKPVTSFTVCANLRRGSGENRTDKPQWFKVNLFGNSAVAITPYLTKGTLIHTEGRLDPELWKDRNGETQLTMNINTNEVTLLKRPSTNSDASASGEAAAATDGDGGGGGDLSDEDIPF